MSIIEESWEPFAEALGYKDERDMLMRLYLNENYSIKEIAHILGPAPWSVRRRLVAHGIPLRSRGGPNKLGKRKLINIKDEDLFTTDVTELAILHNCSESTVFAERRLRRTQDAILPNSTNQMVG